MLQVQPPVIPPLKVVYMCISVPGPPQSFHPLSPTRRAVFHILSPLFIARSSLKKVDRFKPHTNLHLINLFLLPPEQLNPFKQKLFNVARSTHPAIQHGVPSRTGPKGGHCIPASLRSQRTAPASPWTIIQEVASKFCLCQAANISLAHFSSQHDLTQQRADAEKSPYSRSCFPLIKRWPKTPAFSCPTFPPPIL